MRRALFVLLFMGLTSASAQGPGRGQVGGRGQGVQPGQSVAQQATPIDPKKLCKLEGRTVNARTGEPVPRVSLSLTGMGQNRSGRAGRSDNDGRFLIEEIPPGSYRLMADRVGFLREGYGSPTPGGAGAPLNLSDGQHLKGLEFRLTPQGVILGQILDEEGDPLPRTSVVAYRVGTPGAAQAGPPGGMRGGGQAGQTSSASAMANDIGEYRIAGLSPGRYLVVATSQGGGGRGMGGRGGMMALPQTEAEDEAPLPTYYPGTTDSAAALPIEVAPGQDVTGIGITIRRGALHSIQGRVMGGNPQDLPTVRLSLMPRDRSMPGMMGRGGGAQVRQDGSFEISRVAPGSYFILAERMGRQGGGGIVGKSLVDVTSSDIAGLLVPVMDPVAASGTVKVEGQQAASGLQRLVLALMSVDGLPVGTPAGRVADAGAFKIEGVFPDKYYLNVSGLPEGAYIKSVKLANQEVIEKGVDLSNVRTTAILDVLLSLKGATLQGTVTLDDKPATGSYVAVLGDPVRPEQPYLHKFATADQDGKFTIRGLAPGDYKVYAFAEPMPGLSSDPGLARPYERSATSIDVAEGASRQIDLKAIRPGGSQQ